VKIYLCAYLKRILFLSGTFLLVYILGSVCKPNLIFKRLIYSLFKWKGYTNKNGDH